jgi:heptosyltransferase-2
VAAGASNARRLAAGHPQPTRIVPLTEGSKLRNRFLLGTVRMLAHAAHPRLRGRHGERTHHEDVRRILVLELWNIGDVILMMPFLVQLRRLFPLATISLVSRPFAADLLAGTGLVDEFIAADVAWTPPDGVRVPKKMIDLWGLSRRLRARQFDLAFSSRQHLREHFLLALSDARRTVGFAFGKRDAALTDAIAVGNTQRHKVDDWMRLLEPFGGCTSVQIPHLRVEESERSWAKRYLSSRGIERDDLLIGIHPGASLAEKRWPLERFSEVAAATAREHGVRVLAFAEPGGYGSDLFRIPGVVGVHVGLRELMALIERCDLLVCNDSGPMHIAGALGVPTIAMFGAGIEQGFAPLGEGHELLSPDHDELRPKSASNQEHIRAPTGIMTSQVLDAVSRAVRRLRADATFSRV